MVLLSKTKRSPKGLLFVLCKNTRKLFIIFYHIIIHTIKEVILFMNDKKKQDTEKTATDNKWVSTGQARPTDKSERKDGPGGEDAD